jgi:Family of unknown function (DUF6270)
MLTIDLLGSCVTRDAFAMISHDYKLNAYYPRSSLISLYSPPVDIKKDGILIKSEYQQRLIYWDMTKEFNGYIKNSSSDILMIDFMDERLGAIKYSDTFITNSDELRLSNVKKLLNTETLEMDEEYLEIWEIAALRFIHDIRKRPYKFIVLHKSYYLDSYYDKDGNKKMFNEPEVLKRKEKFNRILSRMYHFIEVNLPEIHSIQPIDYLADENHQWGLTPFHYEKAYYQNLMDSLNQITGEKLTV